jgi:hypothetical protein
VSIFETPEKLAVRKLDNFIHIAAKQQGWAIQFIQKHNRRGYEKRDVELPACGRVGPGGASGGVWWGWGWIVACPMHGC